MAETKSTVLYSDADIHEEIHRLIRDNLGTHMSRGYFHVQVLNGVVTLKGNISSTIGYDVFVENLTAIDGVVAVDDDELYSDGQLRRQISNILPRGLRIRVLHGHVALSGRLPQDMDVNEIIGRIAEIRGVQSVNTSTVRQG